MKNMIIDHQSQLKQRKRFLRLCEEIKDQKQYLESKYKELDNCKNTIKLSAEIKTQFDRKYRETKDININIPNFLIIGTQKGGTTWLHENLKKHPQILLPEEKKELEFFSYYQKKINDLGLSSYLKSFNHFDDSVRLNKPIAVGEATPSYFWSVDSARQWCNTPKFFNKDIPASVLNVLGSKVKLILCLRDPVERAISAYFHHVKRERISYSTQNILEIGHLYGIIDMGFYSHHLQAWLAKFNIDNFQILIYEEHIKKDKERTIENICKFLEIDYQLYPTSVNLSTYHNQGLQYRINDNGVFLGSFDNQSESMIVSSDEIKRLREIYYEDYLSLQKMLNMDLSKCWGFS